MNCNIITTDTTIFNFINDLQFLSKGDRMATSKTEWKVIHVDGHELETSLNMLSEQGNEIFSVQYTNPQWTIVYCKNAKEEGKRSMGFKA